MSTPSRKYTHEQIRFVLSQWKSKTRSEIAAEFRAHFGKAEAEFTEKHAKYIKDAYAKHPDWLDEFGHLQTEKQRENARLRAEKRNNSSSVPSGKENLTLSDAGASPSFTNRPQPTSSPNIGGYGVGKEQPQSELEANINVCFDTVPVLGSSNLISLPSRPATPLPTAPLSLTTNHGTPSAASTPAVRPSHNPVPSAQRGIKRGADGVPVSHRLSFGSPLKPNQNWLSPRAVTETPLPLPMQTIQPKPHLSPPKAPIRIDLPKEDFGEDGVWYTGNHDGCQIQGRHRHNNDGTILRRESNKRVLIATEGTEPGKHRTVTSASLKHILNSPVKDNTTQNTNPNHGLAPTFSLPQPSQGMQGTPPDPELIPLLPPLQVAQRLVNTDADIGVLQQQQQIQHKSTDLFVDTIDPSQLMNIPGFQSLSGAVLSPDELATVNTAALSISQGPAPVLSSGVNGRYDMFPRLPDTIEGEHFQKFLYDGFPDFPFSEPLTWRDVPIVHLAAEHSDNDGKSGVPSRAVTVSPRRR